MSYTKASGLAVDRYCKKMYDDVRIRVKKGQKAVIQQRADELGKSINGYMIDLVREDLAEQGVDLETAAENIIEK